MGNLHALISGIHMQMYMFWEVTLTFWADADLVSSLSLGVEMTNRDLRFYAFCQTDRDNKDPDSNL